MTFGKAFETRVEANREVKRIKSKGFTVSSDLAVRKMNKKIHPRRKKLFHVGSFMVFLNFS